MIHATSAARQATTRFHSGLEVGDVERATRFYRLLFDAEPVKVRPGYAKFELDDPPVVLSLIQGNPAPPRRGTADHFGIRVPTQRDVEQAAARLEAAGLEVRRQESTACCYAVQTKVWATDPDGHAWEIYAVLADDAERLEDDSDSCCSEECCT